MGDRGGEIKVSSGQTRIVFSVPEKGALLSVRHRESGESLVSGMCDLWVAELEEGELRSGEADRFDYEAQGAGARLTWSFETAGVAIAVDVVPEGETGTITASWSPCASFSVADQCSGPKVAWASSPSWRRRSSWMGAA